MYICRTNMGWGIIFETGDEAQKIKDFLEKGIEKSSKIDSEQTQKGEQNVGRNEESVKT